MPEEDAKYHMKRCVESGLWVPDARKESTEDETDSTPAASENSADKTA